MAPCSYCRKETGLYFNGRPICIDCMDRIDAGQRPERKEAKREEQAPTN